MNSENQPETKNSGKIQIWISYIFQALVSLMLLMGATFNILQTETAVTGAKEMGYPESSVFYLGIIILISTALYLFPKTSVLGAALITAWLGGAVATHMIHKDPIFNQIFPVIFGSIVWISLWLRDHRLRNVFPFKR